MPDPKPKRRVTLADVVTPRDVLPGFAPRNRAREVSQSFAFQYPTLAGIAEGTGRVARGVVEFIPHALKALSSYTPEELRDPDIRKQLKEDGFDPDAMLHEALQARGRGEPVGASEGAVALLKGVAGMGYNLQRAMQGGEGLYEVKEDGSLGIVDVDMSPRERASAVTEMLGNVGLLGLGARARKPGQPVPKSGQMPTFQRLSQVLRTAADKMTDPGNVYDPGYSALLGLTTNARMTEPGAPAATGMSVSRRGPEVPSRGAMVNETMERINRAYDRPAGIRAPFVPEGAPSVLGTTLADIREQFRSTVGGDPALPRVKSVNEGAATQMADVYDRIKSDPTNPEVRAAYDAFVRETEAQAEALKRAGYTWEFVDNDPYPPTKGGSKAMLRDLRQHKHIKVYKTTGEQSHPLLTNEQNNLFRAVHEIMGHGPDEVSFNAVGEENAFRSHAQAYSPLARRAMANETRGQNSWFNYGPHKKVPAPTRPFSEQKAALWPEDMMGDYESFPAERIAMPSVKGADGEYYHGANHALAEEAAAEALRATPEGRAAMEKNSGSAVIRGSQGFRTTRGRYIARDEARRIAGATGQAPKLAPQYTDLHSSDINNPHNFAGEYPLPKLEPDLGDPKVSPDYVDPARPDLAGFIGTGLNSMTPSDLAGLRVFGAQQSPPNIIIPRGVFDPAVGAPGIAELAARYGAPESGSILDYVEPNTLLRDVPQTLFEGLPRPKSAAEALFHYSNARNILNVGNERLMDAIYRGLDLNRGEPGMSYPYWYNAEPILGNAIYHLGDALGRQRFGTLADYMKPTSINMPPTRNLRNASYQLYRTGHPGLPRYAPGYLPNYPNALIPFLEQLERSGGRMTQPKIEPYGGAIGRGDFGTPIADMHYNRSLEAHGLPFGANADPGVRWGPYADAFVDFAHELASEGILPEIPGRSPVAPAQATMWGGMGEFTGVEGVRTARPTLWQMFEDAAHRGARHLGMNPQDFLGGFWRLEHPLF